ncbi:MAG TPA: class I SAM-dependent methyltransferase [Gaiellaceae bacterium]|nr:class I SAM-dependent methyltransferase [Gaiellaceae bacterium]
MRQDDRAPFVDALHAAREAAYEPGEYVGQESFMRAAEIRELAVRAGVAPGVSVLDLCCGVAGPGRFIARELRCSYLGVDSSASAVAIARGLADGLDCRFEVAAVPPLPDGAFDVVVLLETMLAFADKEALVAAVARALPGGGRFAFTVEEGRPLTSAERNRMPDADTVWLVPVDELEDMLVRNGLAVRWRADWSAEHRATAASLLAAFVDGRDTIASVVGRRAADELVRAHRLWVDWLGRRRVRKLAFVAERC